MKAGYEEERGPDIPSDEKPENIKKGGRCWQWPFHWHKDVYPGRGLAPTDTKIDYKERHGYCIKFIHDSPDTMRVFYVKSRFGNYLLPLAQ